MVLFLEILKFFPYVLSAVMAVEQAAAGMSGSDKKQIVLNSIAGVANVPGGKAVEIISSLIDSTVKQLNLTGVFNHAPDTTATGTTATKSSASV